MIASLQQFVNVRDDNTREIQCLKYADLAVFASANYPTAQTTAQELRGTPTNVFTVCQAADRPAAFDARVTSATAVTAFSSCLTNSAGETLSSLQAQTASLQESSLTSNIETEAEISSLNTEPKQAYLESLLGNPHFKALLENPDLNTLLENPDVKALLENPDVKALVENSD